jgi:hypothetical protein
MLDELIGFLKGEEGKTIEVYAILIFTLTSVIFMLFMIGIKIGQSLRVVFNNIW